MKQSIGLLALAVLGWFFFQLLPLTAPTEPGIVASHMIRDGITDNRAANVVTSVVVNYRGLDTLGEVTVLFLSVAGAAFVLRRRRGIPLPVAHPGSEIVDTAARLLFAPILMFGAYIFIHGHLTPGGGFQGGAVIASAVLLLLLTDRERHLPHRWLGWIESLSGLGFVLTGLWGLAVAGSFLSNRGVLPLGTWNRLFSAGVIPVIYILIGLKVGTELSTLLSTLWTSGEREPEGLS